jgi:hypothetical protein
MGFKGITIRQSADRILFRESIKDSSGLAVVTGSATLRIYELQNDGTLKSYDFNDNTFKTTALTTATVLMTHRTGNNSTVNTGIWTYALTTVSGFTAGNIYISSVNHPSATPPSFEREFQYGGADGDIQLSSTVYTDSNVASIASDTTSATRLKNLFTAVQQGTVDTSGFTATTTQFDTSFTTDKDLFTSQALYFYSGTNSGFTTGITAYTYVGGKVRLTVNALQAAPGNGDSFLAFGKVS